MGQGLYLTLKQTHTLSQSLRQLVGETSGDIPVYSLHKIAGLMKRNKIEISAELEVMLKRAIITANREYKTASGNDWSCLTSNNLVDALESIETEVARINTGAIATMPKEQARQAQLIGAFLTKERARCMAVIKAWFEKNYDALLYDMSGKIPWAIVQRLRRNLGMWIVGSASPFTQDIEEMVLEVASEQSITVDDAEEAWKEMGGKLFDQK